jgi:hypothetical protein
MGNEGQSKVAQIENAEYKFTRKVSKIFNMKDGTLKMN